MTSEAQGARDKLWTMIKRHRFAMLTTRVRRDLGQHRDVSLDRRS